MTQMMCVWIDLALLRNTQYLKEDYDRTTMANFTGHRKREL